MFHFRSSPGNSVPSHCTAMQLLLDMLEMTVNNQSPCSASLLPLHIRDEDLEGALGQAEISDDGYCFASTRIYPLETQLQQKPASLFSMEKIFNYFCNQRIAQNSVFLFQNAALFLSPQIIFVLSGKYFLGTSHKTVIFDSNPLGNRFGYLTIHSTPNGLWLL